MQVKRALIYLLFLGMLPLLGVGMYFITSESELQALADNLQSLQRQALLREKKQATNTAVRNHYRDSDHFYIDKHLETLTFLEPELESLQKVVTHRNFVEDTVVRKRLEYLTSGNTLMFSEGAVQSLDGVQETTESLVHSVEVNSNDIKKILAMIEGVEIGTFHPSPNRPQLLIIDFKLEKKKISDKNEVFGLDMKLLKREFL